MTTRKARRLARFLAELCAVIMISKIAIQQDSSHRDTTARLEQISQHLYRIDDNQAATFHLNKEAVNRHGQPWPLLPGVVRR